MPGRQTPGPCSCMHALPPHVRGVGSPLHRGPRPSAAPLPPPAPRCRARAAPAPRAHVQGLAAAGGRGCQRQRQRRRARQRGAAAGSASRCACWACWALWWWGWFRVRESWVGPGRGPGRGLAVGGWRLAVGGWWRSAVDFFSTPPHPPPSGPSVVPCSVCNTWWWVVARKALSSCHVHAPPPHPPAPACAALQTPHISATFTFTVGICFLVPRLPILNLVPRPTTTTTRPPCPAPFRSLPARLHAGVPGQRQPPQPAATDAVEADTAAGIRRGAGGAAEGEGRGGAAVCVCIVSCSRSGAGASAPPHRPACGFHGCGAHCTVRNAVWVASLVLDLWVTHQAGHIRYQGCCPT